MQLLDLIIIISGWGIGNLIFNNFEKHLPWWRRIAKIVIIVGVLFLIGLIGRIWIYVSLGIMALGIAILHGYWFPKHGINGITAEPYEEYLKLIRKNKDTNPKKQT